MNAVWLSAEIESSARILKNALDISANENGKFWGGKV